jgi:putative ABC transport system ATP-binding protein
VAQALRPAVASPPTTQDPLVRATNVRKVYRSGSLDVNALDGISLDVRPGEMLAVMGPSGCGKTTLLNCLSGLDDIDAGAVQIEGRDLHRLNDDARTRFRAQKMGFIFQSFNLLPVLNAVENVELPLLVSGVSLRAARLEAEKALTTVGLSHRFKHKPKELSGGEQQRVAIARSVVNNPVLVWADEPTGNLDSNTSKEIIALLKQLNQARRQTQVIVTHSEEVARECDRLVRMRNGRIESVQAVKALRGRGA